MDSDGAFLFQNADGMVFWSVIPVPPYDPAWLWTLRGGDSLEWRLGMRGVPQKRQTLILERMWALWNPGRVVSEWMFVLPQNAEAYRAALALKWETRNTPRVVRPNPQPTPPRGGEGPSPWDDTMVVEAFDADSNAFHMAFSAGANVIKAYTNSPYDVAVCVSKELNAPTKEWGVLTNFPNTVLASPFNFSLPFEIVPGKTNAVPPVHDNTCVSHEIIIHSPLGLAVYTNIVWLCGHEGAQPADRAFFKTLIPDDGHEFHGITRLWLARNNLLGAFADNPAMAFAFVPDNNPFELTYLDFFNNNFNLPGPPGLNDPFPDLAPEDKFTLPFHIYGDYASWMMTIKGQGPADTLTRTLSTAYPGQSNERNMVFRKGNSYLIKMNWTGTAPWDDSTWYCWEAQVGNYFNRQPLYQTYTGWPNTPNVYNGNAPFIMGTSYYIDNAQGLMTSHVHSDDNTGGNIAGGLEATLYVLKFTFATPAGDPVTEPDDSTVAQNQYTFSAATGELTIGLRVKVDPSDFANKYAGDYFFTVDTIPGSTIVWAGANPNGRAIASEGNNYLSAIVTYEGLPADNNSFGWKTASLRYGGNAGAIVASAPYGVFFDKNANNHPPCATCPDCPNWFYYWKQGGVCSIPETSVYRTTIEMSEVELNAGVIRLGRNAAKETFPITKTAPNPVYGTITVRKYGEGIQCVAQIIKHEQEHIKVHNNFEHLWDPVNDRDGDNIPNDYEATYRDIATDPDDCDTFQLMNPPVKNGDEELRCMRAEEAVTVDVDFFPTKDWANPGRQHKVKSEL